MAGMAPQEQAQEAGSGAGAHRQQGRHAARESPPARAPRLRGHAVGGRRRRAWPTLLQLVLAFVPNPFHCWGFLLRLPRLPPAHHPPDPALQLMELCLTKEVKKIKEKLVKENFYVATEVYSVSVGTILRGRDG